jgi:hypothetical protein
VSQFLARFEKVVNNFSLRLIHLLLLFNLFSRFFDSKFISTDLTPFTAEIIFVERIIIYDMKHVNPNKPECRKHVKMMNKTF